MVSTRSTECVRWGILGCAQIADLRMAPAIKGVPNAELVGVSSRNVDKARAFAKKHGVRKYYGNLDEFLGDSEIDAVYIASPPNLHLEHTKKVAQHKKHILCEKPMATTLADCQEMISVCRQENVKLMIGCNMRFNPAHVKAKEIIGKGLLGKVIFMRAQESFYLPPDPEAWRQQSAVAGGGSLSDAGVHGIDLLRFLVGSEVVEVSAFVDNVVFDYSVEDTAIVIMKFANGGYGFVDSCYSSRYVENVLEVYGSKGTLLGKKTLWVDRVPGELRGYFNQTRTTHELAFAPPWGQESSLGGLGSLMKLYNLRPRDTYAAEVEHLSECIRQDKPPMIEGVEGLRDLQVVKAAYESSIKRGSVKLSELQI